MTIFKKRFLTESHCSIYFCTEAPPFKQANENALPEFIRFISQSVRAPFKKCKFFFFFTFISIKYYFADVSRIKFSPSFVKD
uniref:Uncharacterized protein n=1 Tax=Lutzomyia longipalpis TaxID=7200 RepID=A0A7G3B913_LUTLO